MVLRTFATAMLVIGLSSPLIADEEETGAEPRTIEPTQSELAQFSLGDRDRDLSADTGGSVGFSASALSMFAASAADIATTEWGLSQGFVEGNPVVAQRGVRIATHIAAPIAVYWATERLHRSGKKKLAFFLRLSIMAAYSYAAIHNTRMITTNPGAGF